MCAVYGRKSPVGKQHSLCAVDLESGMHPHFSNADLRTLPGRAGKIGSHGGSDMLPTHVFRHRAKQPHVVQDSMLELNPGSLLADTAQPMPRSFAEAHSIC